MTDMSMPKNYYFWNFGIWNFLVLTFIIRSYFTNWFETRVKTRNFFEQFLFSVSIITLYIFDIQCWQDKHLWSHFAYNGVNSVVFACAWEGCCIIAASYWSVAGYRCVTLTVNSIIDNVSFFPYMCTNTSKVRSKVWSYHYFTYMSSIITRLQLHNYDYWHEQVS